MDWCTAVCFGCCTIPFVYCSCISSNGNHLFNHRKHAQESISSEDSVTTVFILLRRCVNILQIEYFWSRFGSSVFCIRPCNSFIPHSGDAHSSPRTWRIQYCYQSRISWISTAMLLLFFTILVGRIHFPTSVVSTRRSRHWLMMWRNVSLKTFLCKHCF